MIAQISSSLTDPFLKGSNNNNNITSATKNPVKSRQRDARRASRRNSTGVSTTGWPRIVVEKPEKEKAAKAEATAPMSPRKASKSARQQRRNSTGATRVNAMQAKFMIHSSITEQKQRVAEMQTLIDHTQAGVEARMESQNQIGAIIFMKLILKYEAQRDHALSCVEQLELLLADVELSGDALSSADYSSKVRAITAVPASVPSFDNDEAILAEIKRRL
jgi:hypothetical protein